MYSRAVSSDEASPEFIGRDTHDVPAVRSQNIKVRLPNVDLINTKPECIQTMFTHTYS